MNDQSRNHLIDLGCSMSFIFSQQGANFLLSFLSMMRRRLLRPSLSANMFSIHFPFAVHQTEAKLSLLESQRAEEEAGLVSVLFPKATSPSCQSKPRVGLNPGKDLYLVGFHQHDKPFLTMDIVLRTLHRLGSDMKGPYA